MTSTSKRNRPTTWERRMADKAAARRAAEEAAWSEESERDWAKTEEQYVQQRTAELTVEKAQYLRDNPFMGACACMGGKMCCRITSQAIERVLGNGGGSNV